MSKSVTRSCISYHNINTQSRLRVTAVSGDPIGPPGDRSGPPLPEPPGKTRPNWSPGCLYSVTHPGESIIDGVFNTRLSTLKRYPPHTNRSDTTCTLGSKTNQKEKDNQRDENQSEGWTGYRGPIRRTIDGSRENGRPVWQ